MKHPDPRKLRGIAKRLQVRAAQPHVLDMDMIQVERSSCGTHACIAGHWLDIRSQDADVAPLMKHRRPELVSPKGCAWDWGMNLLAFDAGLWGESSDCALDTPPCHNKRSLRRWAKDNPDLWGNLQGGFAFRRDALYRGAWTEPGAQPARGLAQVAEHLLRVAARIEAEQRISQLRDISEADGSEPAPSILETIEP